MMRGEIYRTGAGMPESGHKPGFYVVVSRNFVASNEDISTEILGIRSEVSIGVEEGLRQLSAIRCDFLTFMFKRKLTGFIALLLPKKQRELDAALGYALGLR
jgi:hypothetical protein